MEEACDAKEKAVILCNKKVHEMETKCFKQVDEGRIQITELKSRVSELAVDLEKSRNSEKRLQNEVKTLEGQQNEFLKREEKKLFTLEEKNKKALEQKRSEHVELQKKLQKAERQIQKYEEVLESERLIITQKLRVVHEEGTRRQKANDDLITMLETQVVEMKEMFNNIGQNGDLAAKLAERTAAVENLRAQLSKDKVGKKNTQESSNSRIHWENTKQIVDLADLSVLELRCSRLEVEKRNVETEARLLQNKFDDSQSALHTLKEKNSNLKKSEEKGKIRIKSIAKIANGKTRTLKAEAARLRDQIDVMRKNWRPPGEWNEQEKLIRTLRNTIRSLKKDLQKKSEASQKLDQEKKDDTKRWKDMESSLKRAEEQRKRAVGEVARKASVEQQLRKKIEICKTSSQELIKKVGRYETQIKGLKLALEQRKTAMESMRHVIDAQKSRLAAIQDTVQNQKSLEESYREAKIMAERKSRETKRAVHRAAEAESTCREALDKISALKSSLDKVEKSNRKLKDSSARKIVILEEKLNSVKDGSSASILSVAENLIENNQRLRSRVGALKSALMSPPKSEKKHSTEQLSSVASMLDMSMQEVKSLLGSAKKGRES